MNLNVQRGLNRLYVVLCLGWIVFMLWYPHRERQQRFERDLSRTNGMCSEVEKRQRRAEAKQDQRIEKAGDIEWQTLT
jgi:type II secretory pathway component PulM